MTKHIWFLQANENESPRSPSGQNPSSQLEQSSATTGTTQTSENKPTEHSIDVPATPGRSESPLQHGNQQSSDLWGRHSPEASGETSSSRRGKQPFRRLRENWKKVSET